MKIKSFGSLLAAAFFLLAGTGQTTTASETATVPAGREKLLMDTGWRFAFGHPTDPKKILVPARAAFPTSQKLVMATGRRRVQV